MSGAALPSHGARILRVIGIVLVFILLGPPVGGLVFMMTIALIGLGKSTDLAGLSWIALFAVIYAVPLSYFAGIIPAAVAGLMIGIRQAYFGPATWWQAAAVGLLIGFTIVYLAGQSLAFDGEAPVPVLMVTCLVATLICWLVVRGWSVAHNLGTGVQERAS